MQPARQYGQAVWLTALGNGGRLIGGNSVGQADDLGGLNYPPCFWLFWAQFHDFWGLSTPSKTGLMLNTEEKKEFQTLKNGEIIEGKMYDMLFGRHRP